MFSWFTVLFQLADYAVKAMVWYKDTEAGAKEWADIQNAYEGALATDINGDGVVGSNRTAPPQADQVNPTAENSTADVQTVKRRIVRG